VDTALHPSVADVLAGAGVTAEEVAGWASMSGGTYNSVVRVVLRDGRRWVVKVPPGGGRAAGLAYEHDLLRGEAEYFRAAAGAGGAPVPRVVHLEQRGEPPVVSALVLTECPGTPWTALDSELEKAERARLRTELGGIVGRLHTVTGDAFGYPARPFGTPLAATWREAFTGMTDAVLDDAVRYDARLPHPVAGIRTLFASAAGVLDDVTRPVLVHFDLWQGNVLLDGAPGARTVGGIVDGERMFWGDPVAEFVSLALFGDIERDAAFLAGYAAAGGATEFTGSVRLRLALYRCYLYLIMLVEGVPRGYTGERADWVREHAGGGLTRALREVAAGA
jgi:aminoglycoside phosphotransferase (APT) family kinase protein